MYALRAGMTGSGCVRCSTLLQRAVVKTPDEQEEQMVRANDAMVGTSVIQTCLASSAEARQSYPRVSDISAVVGAARSGCSRLSL